MRLVSQVLTTEHSSCILCMNAKFIGKYFQSIGRATCLFFSVFSDRDFKFSSIISYQLYVSQREVLKSKTILNEKLDRRKCGRSSYSFYVFKAFLFTVIQVRKIILKIVNTWNESFQFEMPLSKEGKFNKFCENRIKIIDILINFRLSSQKTIEQ